MKNHVRNEASQWSMVLHPLLNHEIDGETENYMAMDLAMEPQELSRSSLV